MIDPIQRLRAIKDQIGSLKREAFAILDSLGAGLDSTPARPTAAASATSTPATPRGKKAAQKPRGTRKRSPSGPLAPAVVALLKAAGKPLKVAIYDGLLAANYVFTSGNAKKNLGIRLYTLPPVKSLGGGLFGLDEGTPTT